MKCDAQGHIWYTDLPFLISFVLYSCLLCSLPVAKPRGLNRPPAVSN